MNWIYGRLTWIQKEMSHPCESIRPGAISKRQSVADGPVRDSAKHDVHDVLQHDVHLVLPAGSPALQQTKACVVQQISMKFGTLILYTIQVILRSGPILKVKYVDLGGHFEF